MSHTSIDVPALREAAAQFDHDLPHDPVAMADLFTSLTRDLPSAPAWWFADQLAAVPDLPHLVRGLLADRMQATARLALVTPHLDDQALQSVVPDVATRRVVRKLEVAVTLIRTKLAAGPQRSQVMLDAGHAIGIGKHTMHRAKDALCVVPTLHGEGGEQFWTWRLP